LQPARRTWTRQPPRLPPVAEYGGQVEVEWGGLVDKACGEAKLACLSVIDLAGRFFIPNKMNYIKIK